MTTELTELQIATIIDGAVPIVAEPGDEEFFRSVLRCLADSVSAADFLRFIDSLLTKAQGEKA